MKRKIFILLLTLLTVLCSICFYSCNSEEAKTDNPEIITEPQSVSINYPDGANFNVEVKNPDDVLSYQWQEWLKGYGEDEVWEDMDGITAKTNELTIKSFDPECFSCKFRCVIKGKNGSTVISNVATVDILNRETEFIPFVKVCEYAVRAGETLDLSSTPYGTGKVSMSQTGEIITLNSVKLNNEKCIASSLMSSIAFELISRTNALSSYTFNIVGYNEIINVRYDEDNNAAGIPICCNFLNGCEVFPMVIVSGSGTLDIEGGTEMIFSSSSVTVDTNLVFKGTKDIWANGIKAREKIILGSNCTIYNRGLNGSVVLGDGYTTSVIIDGAKIYGSLSAGKVGSGSSSFYAIRTQGDTKITNATIELNLISDANRFLPEMGYITSSTAISGENVNISDSNITLNYDVSIAEEEFCANYTGINASNDLNITNSSIKINLDAPTLFNSCAISGDYIDIINSNLNLTIKSQGNVYGINATGIEDTSLKIENSAVNIEIFTYDEIPYIAYGVKAESLYLEFNDIKDTLHVSSNLMALAVRVEQGENEWNYADDYIPQNVTIINAVVSSPDGGTVNQYTSYGKRINTHIETVYNLDKTYANEFTFSYPSPV